MEHLVSRGKTEEGSGEAKQFGGDQWTDSREDEGIEGISSAGCRRWQVDIHIHHRKVMEQRHQLENNDNSKKDSGQVHAPCKCPPR